MEREVGAGEFAEWIAYDRISPIDIRERVELSAAIVAATVANVFGGSSGHRPEPADFMPDWSRPGAAATPEQVDARQEAMFRAFAAAHNASVKRRGG